MIEEQQIENQITKKKATERNREESWNYMFDQIWEFAQKNHRGPTRHHIEEHRLLNWLKYNRKKRNSGAMSPTRAEKFKKLTDLISSFQRVNQFK